MKTWAKTKIIEVVSTEDGSICKNAYLVDQNVVSSMIELSDTECLCRVAGTPAQIATILTDAAITEQTDEQAETTLQSKHPDSSLENLDIADPEIDAIAKSLELDPHSRADIQTASRGKQLLQDQENYLLAMISTKKGKSKQFWDNAAGKSGKYPKGIDIENDVLDGKGSAHEFVLSRLR